MQAGTLDIISTSAPQACHVNSDASNQHYQQLQTFIDERYAYSPKIICGDFNARLIKATLGAQSHEVDTLSTAQLDNRSRMVEFYLENNLVISNTFFQKAEDHLVTYQAVGITNWTAPWDSSKFAQMDYIVVNNKWKMQLLM